MLRKLKELLGFYNLTCNPKKLCGEIELIKLHFCGQKDNLRYISLRYIVTH